MDRATPRLVDRGELLAALDRAAAGKVTVLSAPAGSGKTSLLRAWADRRGQPRRLAVLQVQRDQHDDQQFWLALLDAVRQATGTTSRVEPPTATPDFNGPAMAGRVLSELADARHGITLVIDDLHELRSPEALAQLTRLLTNAGWMPLYNLNLSEDVPGYLAAPATALSSPWTHFIGGHLSRLGTRDDLSLHQRYIADIQAGAREALATVDPTPYFVRYGENVWAAVKSYLDELTDRAAKPVIAKYTGVLAAADVEVFTTTTTFMILQSMRLDLGPSAPVHP